MYSSVKNIFIFHSTALPFGSTVPLLLIPLT